MLDPKSFILLLVLLFIITAITIAVAVIVIVSNRKLMNTNNNEPQHDILEEILNKLKKNDIIKIINIHIKNLKNKYRSDIYKFPDLLKFKNEYTSDLIAPKHGNFFIIVLTIIVYLLCFELAHPWQNPNSKITSKIKINSKNSLFYAPKKI